MNQAKSSYALSYFSRNSGRKSCEIKKGFFEDLLESRSTVVASLEFEILFSVLCETFVDFEKTLVSHAVDEIWSSAFSSVDFIEFNVRFNTKVISILSAARSYHDQRKRFGSRLVVDANVGVIEDIYSTEFDRSFDFRLVESLRNYAQHSDLPVNFVSILRKNLSEGNFGEGERSVGRITVHPTFSKRKILARRDKLRGATMDELQDRQGENLCAVSYLRSYASSIMKCHAQARELVSSRLIDAEAKLKEANAIALNHSGGEEIFGLEAVHGEERHFVDLELLERLNVRKKAFRSGQFVHRLFPSSQIVARKDTDYGDREGLWIP
jgi:hypothetical protein